MPSRYNAKRMALAPNYRITAETARALMAIEASRAAVDRLPITARLIASLRESARLLSTHYSTQIEGNRLTAVEVERVIAGHGGFPGRERDETEVRNYYRAVDKAEAVAALETGCCYANCGPCNDRHLDCLCRARL